MKSTAENKPQLQVGLLLDSLFVPAWAWEMIRIILKENLASIDFVLLNQSPKASGGRSPFLYRAFSKLDRYLFKVNSNAFERKDLQLIPGFKAEIISIHAIQAKFSDKFSKEDLEIVRNRKPDILIRLGFRILKGEILAIPRLGVWSYHHGDNLINRGGPPCFWEVMLGWHETGSVLQILSDKLDDGKVIYRSWSHTDPLSVHRNANKVYWKSLFFIPRQLGRINRIGVEAWRKEVDERESKYKVSDTQLRKPPGNWQMLQLVSKLALRTFTRKSKEVLNREVWEIWLFDQKTGNPILIENPKGSYLADPFLIKKESKNWLFAEQFDYKNRKGFISCSKIMNDGSCNFQKVLEESFHLSYPFVWEENGEFWMIVESASKKEFRIYKSSNFPFQWEWDKSQFQGEELFDPTICKKDGLYWLFANQKEHSGSSSFDELFLYYSPDFRTGDWISHPQNPIVSDVKSSRPAGSLFEENGQWFRPAQDSAKHYGHRIRIQRIVKWDTENYEEVTNQIMEADWEKGWKGTHTLNFNEDWRVMDTFKR
jgi:hypothetical protein